MKKFLSMSLVVVMVLALGSFAMASGLNGELEAQIPVKAEIGPYAAITDVVGVDFGDILGAVGEYKATTPGSFKIEANTKVILEFEVENSNWIDSPYKFIAMKSHGNPLTNFHAPFGKWEGVQETNIATIGYYKGVSGVEIDGYIGIESISQNKAGEYETTILVTVSQQ